ncbi:unnamed protein product [Moneuplotes crassus]|uniref:Uncharacterized protein n=1 Tax=Euplotes crassus TaxID=5936 RepID=A0AAD2D3T9_EUPCR|nr:unnamed protein product [Moneuplotes crassus]
MKIVLLALVICTVLLLQPTSAVYNLRRNMKSYRSIKDKLNKDVSTTEKVVDQQSKDGIGLEERSLAGSYQSNSRGSGKNNYNFQPKNTPYSSQDSDYNSYSGYDDSSADTSYQGSSNSGYNSNTSQDSYSNDSNNSQLQSSQNNQDFSSQDSSRKSENGRSLEMISEELEYQKPVDKYSGTDNMMFFDDWSPHKDRADRTYYYQKSTTIGFDPSDLGIHGIYINEADFKDVV